MKVLLTACLILFIVVPTHSQKQKKINEIDSMTFENLNNPEITANFKNIVKLSHYKLSNGDWISVGDTLVIGEPSNQNSLEASTVIQGGRINNHTHLFMGTGAAVMMGGAMMGNQNLVGQEGFIWKLKMGRISKKQPYFIEVQMNKVGGGNFFGVKKVARGDLEKLLSSRELVNPKASMTRQEAIAKLKEAKDLLDLEMMTQEEYDELKKKLAPIIRGEK